MLPLVIPTLSTNDDDEAEEEDTGVLMDVSSISTVALWAAVVVDVLAIVDVVDETFPFTAEVDDREEREEKGEEEVDDPPPGAPVDMNTDVGEGLPP